MSPDSASPSPPPHSSSSPTFPTPLTQSTRSDILTLPFPKPHHKNLSLTGRSRAAWHTSFVVPELNLLLDAGLFVGEKVRPKHIFITHGHADHTLVAFSFTKREDPPDVVVPKEMAQVFDDYVLANTMLNLGGLIGTEDEEQAEQITEEDELENEKKDNNATVINNEEIPCRSHRPAGEKAFLNTHITHALSPGDNIALRRMPHISATAFACDHTVPSLGYLFSRTTHKLSPEHASKSPDELKKLKQDGKDITVPYTTPIFAFLGDGTASTLASDPSWLVGDENGEKVAMVITECSFLYEEHRAQAERTKHTIWKDLEPVVKKHKDVTFVLIHFSRRYTEGEVVRFFKELKEEDGGGQLGNVVVWADPEADD